MKKDQKLELLLKYFEKKYQKSLRKVEREMIKAYMSKENILK
ncbi:hypothetical protein [Alkalihalobacillus pseudalcaliphilus]|nr:hypothetical protein [Alkalihalobacillus pseudalcaliphilus]